MPRPSPIRDQVRDLLLVGPARPWSLDELLEVVRDTLPGANYSSVFRAAAGLEEQRLVERLDVGDGHARYERAGSHHDHIRCRGCGRVADLSGECLVAPAERRVEDLTGFQVSGHQLVFEGLCPDCSR